MSTHQSNGDEFDSYDDHDYQYQHQIPPHQYPPSHYSREARPPGYQPYYYNPHFIQPPPGYPPLHQNQLMNPHSYYQQGQHPYAEHESFSQHHQYHPQLPPSNNNDIYDDEYEDDENDDEYQMHRHPSQRPSENNNYGHRSSQNVSLPAKPFYPTNINSNHSNHQFNTTLPNNNSINNANSTPPYSQNLALHPNSTVSFPLDSNINHDNLKNCQSSSSKHQATTKNGPKFSNHTPSSATISNTTKVPVNTNATPFFLSTNQFSDPNNDLNHLVTKKTPSQSTPSCTSRLPNMSLTPQLDPSNPSQSVPSMQSSSTSQQQMQQPSNTKYKSEMCKNFLQYGQCPYAASCQFAHSENELRLSVKPRKFRTQNCRNFTLTGTCPYAHRCCFRHIGPDGEEDMAQKLFHAYGSINPQLLAQEGAGIDNDSVSPHSPHNSSIQHKYKVDQSNQIVNSTSSSSLSHQNNDKTHKRSLPLSDDPLLQNVSMDTTIPNNSTSNTNANSSSILTISSKEPHDNDHIQVLMPQLNLLSPNTTAEIVKKVNEQHVVTKKDKNNHHTVQNGQNGEPLVTNGSDFDTKSRQHSKSVSSMTSSTHSTTYVNSNSTNETNCINYNQITPVPLFPAATPHHTPNPHHTTPYSATSAATLSTQGNSLHQHHQLQQQNQQTLGYFDASYYNTNTQPNSLPISTTPNSCHDMIHTPSQLHNQKVQHHQQQQQQHQHQQQQNSAQQLISLTPSSHYSGQIQVNTPQVPLSTMSSSAMSVMMASPHHSSSSLTPSMHPNHMIHTPYHHHQLQQHGLTSFSLDQHMMEYQHPSQQQSQQQQSMNNAPNNTTDQTPSLADLNVSFTSLSLLTTGSTHSSISQPQTIPNRDIQNQQQQHGSAQDASVNIYDACNQTSSIYNTHQNQFQQEEQNYQHQEQIRLLSNNNTNTNINSTYIPISSSNMSNPAHSVHSTSSNVMGGDNNSIIPNTTIHGEQSSSTHQRVSPELEPTTPSSILTSTPHHQNGITSAALSTSHQYNNSTSNPFDFQRGLHPPPSSSYSYLTPTNQIDSIHQQHPSQQHQHHTPNHSYIPYPSLSHLNVDPFILGSYNNNNDNHNTTNMSQNNVNTTLAASGQYGLFPSSTTPNSALSYPISTTNSATGAPISGVSGTSNGGSAHNSALGLIPPPTIQPSIRQLGFSGLSANQTPSQGPSSQFGLNLGAPPGLTIASTRLDSSVHTTTSPLPTDFELPLSGFHSSYYNIMPQKQHTNNNHTNIFSPNQQQRQQQQQQRGVVIHLSDDGIGVSNSQNDVSNTTTNPNNISTVGSLPGSVASPPHNLQIFNSSHLGPNNLTTTMSPLPNDV